MRPLFVRIAAIALIVPMAPSFGKAVPAEDGAAKDEMICRKFLETGSLVKKRKVCMTKSEWTRVQTSQREGSQKMVQDLSGGFREQCGMGC